MIQYLKRIFIQNTQTYFRTSKSFAAFNYICASATCIIKCLYFNLACPQSQKGTQKGKLSLC